MIRKVEEIPFSRLPRVSDLFRDYVIHSSKTLAFYQHSPTLDEIERAAADTLAHVSFSRGELVAILKRQNARFGADEKNHQSIQELEQNDCVAVVTGQQVGIFGGPLYTIHKTLTALRLAAELRNKRIRAVPVFWMDSEDHDLAEVTHITVPGAEGSATSMDFRNRIFGSSSPEGVPVGSVEFPKEIVSAVAEFSASLPDSDWKSETLSWLERAYAPGTTFADAFGRLMLHLFRNTGLVIFNPLDPEAKRLLRALFRRCIGNNSEIDRALLERNRALEQAGYEPQVNLTESSTLLFLTGENQRRALTRHDDHFELKNTERSFTEAELLQMADRSPEIFSPNVLLRPLAQDHLFPTVTYVAGPAEVAYFAQAETLYRFYERPMPVIWPRAGFTLVEPEIALDMDRYAIHLDDLFQGRQHLVEGALQASNQGKAMSVLNDLEHNLEHSLDELRPALAAVDVSLDHAAETVKRKVLHQVETIRGRFARIEASQNSELLRAMDRILGCCYPNGNLQERELSVHPFAARHGLALLGALRDLLNPEDFSHRVVYLEK